MKVAISVAGIRRGKSDVCSDLDKIGTGVGEEIYGDVLGVEICAWFEYWIFEGCRIGPGARYGEEIGVGPDALD